MMVGLSHSLGVVGLHTRNTDQPLTETRIVFSYARLNCCRPFDHCLHCLDDRLAVRPGTGAEIMGQCCELANPVLLDLKLHESTGAFPSRCSRCFVFSVSAESRRRGSLVLLRGPENSDIYFGKQILLHLPPPSTLPSPPPARWTIQARTATTPPPR